MNADNWYVRTATGEQTGPLSEAQVRETLIRTTDLQGTKVRQGNSAWIDASYVLNRFKELMERGVYLAHQNQTLGPFTTEHANKLIQQHASISQYRVGENDDWKAIDSSRTVKIPPEPPPSPKPKQPPPAPKNTPILLDRELAELRLGSGVPMQKPIDTSTTRFDPYRVWLGVPKGIKRPNYYHILGIAQGESNVQVIRSAIEQRRSYVTSKRGEGHDESIHQILSLIEEAAATLLVTEFKHGYDRHLGLHFQEKSKRVGKALLLPPWMESRVVRVYGEGGGLLLEVLGLVAILFGAFALMAWVSFQFPWQKMTSEVATASNLEALDPIQSQTAEPDDDSTRKPEPMVPTELPKNASRNESLSSASSPEPLSENQANSDIANPPKITNSIGMKLTRIEPGTFIMGEGKDAHQVTITKPYYLGTYEVTQSEYQQVIGKDPSTFKGADNPVDSVSWNDAANFCRALSAMPKEIASGHVYRLPTEAEWEYACRAGTTTAYSFGEDKSELEHYGWYGDNSGHTRVNSATLWQLRISVEQKQETLMSRGCRPHPVGRKAPNALGLYDMHGNLWEWCADWYADYSMGALSDPVGPANGKERVARGGSWQYATTECRSAERGELNPSIAPFDFGFRVALNIETDRIKEQEELAASKSTVIVTVTPADAKVLVTGNGVTITGSGAKRVISVENPMGDYRLIATMDGYKSVDVPLHFEKRSTQSSVVMLERMEPVAENPRDLMNWANVPLPNPVLYLSGDRDALAIPRTLKVKRWEGDFVEGKIGNALRFNGKQHIELTCSLPTGNAPRSVALWVKMNRKPSSIVHIFNYGNQNFEDKKKGQPFGLKVTSSEGWRFFDFTSGLDSNVPCDTNWHHHIISFDGSLMRYYFDGKETAKSAKKISTASGTLILGGLNNPWYNLDGLIDEFYIFDRALNNSQVKALYNRPTTFR